MKCSDLTKWGINAGGVGGNKVGVEDGGSRQQIIGSNVGAGRYARVITQNDSDTIQYCK